MILYNKRYGYQGFFKKDIMNFEYSNRVPVRVVAHFVTTKKSASPTTEMALHGALVKMVIQGNLVVS